MVLMVVDAAMVVEGHGPLSDDGRSFGGGDHRRDGKIRIAWEGKGGRRRRRKRRRRRRRKEK